jgi:hypothetical protein
MSGTPEQRKRWRRAYYLRHRERLLAKFKEYRDTKKDKTKHAAYMKAYYAANREKIRAKHKAYWEENRHWLNPANVTGRQTGRITTNKARKREWTRARRKQPDQREKDRLYCQRENVRIKRNLSRRIRHALRGTRKAASTIELVGCSIDDLKLFLQSHFTPEMQWNNMGTYWHLDHYVPCAAHDLRLEDEQRRCFHWSNLRPLKIEDNLKKNDVDPRTGVSARRAKS